MKLLVSLTKTTSFSWRDSLIRLPFYPFRPGF
jgi:hypothetical protein